MAACEHKLAKNMSICYDVSIARDSTAIDFITDVNSPELSIQRNHREYEMSGIAIST